MTYRTITDFDIIKLYLSPVLIDACILLINGRPLDFAARKKLQMLGPLFDTIESICRIKTNEKGR